MDRPVASVYSTEGGFAGGHYVPETLDASRALSDEQAGVAREQLTAGRAAGEKYGAIGDQITQAQLDEAKQASSRSTATWDRYNKIFAPIQDQVAKEAMNYDSPERIARKEAEAASGVSTQFDAAQERQRMNLASYGINPASGRSMESERATEVARAGATAGAMTQARTQTQDTGLALRSGVAQFGQGIAQTGLATGGQAIGANQAAGGQNVSNLQTRLAAPNSALPWYGAAAGTLANTGQQAGNLYNTYTKAYGDTLNYNMASKGIVSDVTGGVMGMVGGMMSSEDSKTDRKPIASEGILPRIEALPDVEAWSYKQGKGDGGDHIGPMAEDVQAKLGNRVAPGGKVIDMISMNGILLGGMKEEVKARKNLEKRIDQLEKRAA